MNFIFSHFLSVFIVIMNKASKRNIGINTITQYGVWDRLLTRRLLFTLSTIAPLMILNAPRDRDRNVKNNNASNFMKWFKISLIMRIDWGVRYQFVGKCIPHTTMTVLLPQSEHWIFGMSNEYGPFYLCTVYIKCNNYDPYIFFLPHALFEPFLFLNEHFAFRTYINDTIDTDAK